MIISAYWYTVDVSLVLYSGILKVSSLIQSNGIQAPLDNCKSVLRQSKLACFFALIFRYCSVYHVAEDHVPSTCRSEAVSGLAGDVFLPELIK
jgi:hypothetical protein